MPSRRARGNGLRTKHACSIPGRTTSSTKVPWPVSSRASSTRCTRLPAYRAAARGVAFGLNRPWRWCRRRSR